MSVYKHWKEAEFYGKLSDWLTSFGFDWFCCLFGIISFPSLFIPCRLNDHKNVFFCFNLYFTDFVFFMYKISEGKLFFWCCLFFCLLPLVLTSHSALTQSLSSFLITSTTSWSSLVVSFVTTCYQFSLIYSFSHYRCVLYLWCFSHNEIRESLFTMLKRKDCRCLLYQKMSQHYLVSAKILYRKNIFWKLYTNYKQFGFLQSFFSLHIYTLVSVSS